MIRVDLEIMVGCETRSSDHFNHQHGVRMRDTAVLRLGIRLGSLFDFCL